MRKVRFGGAIHTMSAPFIASYCTTFLKPEMRHIYRQVTGLQRYRTFVLTLRRECPERYPFDDIEVIPPARINPLRRFWLKYLNRRPPVIYRGEYDTLRSILQRRGASLMHIYFGHTGVHLLPFIEAWPGRCLVSFHGMDVKDRPDQPEYAAKLRAMLLRVPLVLARSKSLAARLEALGCPPDKIRVQRTGIPLDAFPFIERRPPLDGAWRITQACRLVEKKGLPDTLEAFAVFLRHYPQATLTIAGEGPLLPELERHAGRLGIASRVRFPGFLDQPGLAALYADSHIFIHPSRTTAGQDQEGVPNSLLEAMATGLPVVATRHGGIPEAVEDGVSGLLVPEGDAPAASAALLRIAADPDLAARLGRSASETIRREFERSAQIARLESCYDELRAL